MKKFVLIGEEYAAAKILNTLVDKAGVSVCAVFSNTSKKGPLLSVVEQRNLDFFDSSELAEEKTLDWLENQRCDWLVNILSAVIIPERILRLFPGSALNLHTGPLPEYAGIHVHQWGIRNGEEKFGVTIHQMEPGIDTGSIVGERQFDITPSDTGLSLYNKAMKEGAGLFQEILDNIVLGNHLPCRPQNLANRTYYSKKDALDGRINWGWPASHIVNFVRAGNYYPFKSPTYTATIELDSQSIQILAVSELEAELIEAEPGTILGLCDDGPRISCGNNDSVIIIKAIDSFGVISKIRWGQYLGNSSYKIL